MKLGLIWKVEVRLDPNLSHRCNMGTFTCWLGQRSHIKVSGHLRSSFKIGWNIKVTSFEKLKSDWKQTVYGYNMGPFVVHAVRGHILRSKVIRGQVGLKCKMYLIWNVEVWVESNLIYWYYAGVYTWTWCQRSQIKVKGHVRSTCKIVWNSKILLTCFFHK